MTELDDFSLDEMVASVLGLSSQQTIPEVQDSESRANGDGSGLEFCGPRVYSVSGGSHPFVSIDNDLRQISVQSSDSADIGQHDIEIFVTL